MTQNKYDSPPYARVTYFSVKHLSFCRETAVEKKPENCRNTRDNEWKCTGYWHKVQGERTRIGGKNQKVAQFLRSNMRNWESLRRWKHRPSVRVDNGDRYASQKSVKRARVRTGVSKRKSVQLVHSFWKASDYALTLHRQVGERVYSSHFFRVYILSLVQLYRPNCRKSVFFDLSFCRKSVFFKHRNCRKSVFFDS